MTVSLIDQVLPSFDVRIVHTGVFLGSPERCLDAALSLDVLRSRFVRVLVAARARFGSAAAPPALSIATMTQPPFNWLQLGERPGRELLLGQISTPWQRRVESVLPSDAEAFRGFGQPGFAKIVLAIRAEPYDAGTSRLTFESRVLLTDPDSRRRFRRYWLVVGPGSDLIRRLALRALATELGTPPTAAIAGEIEIARPVQAVFDFVADERNEPRFNQRLTSVEKITPGPVGKGTQFRAVLGSGRRRTEMTVEFTEFQRPHRLGSTSRLPGMTVSGTLVFEPTPLGTRMRWAWTLHPTGALRLLKPILPAIGRRQEVAIWRSLKRYLESESPNRYTGGCKQ